MFAVFRYALLASLLFHSCWLFGADDAEKEKQKAEKKRKEDRLASIKAVTFDRRPSNILLLWSNKGKKDSTGFDVLLKNLEAKEASKADIPTTVPETPPVAVVNVESGNATVSENGEPKSEELKAKEAEAKAKEAEAKAKAEEELKAKQEKAKAAQEKKEKKDFEEALKSLSETVTIGDWELFGKALSNRQFLSEEESVAVYDRMLDELRKDVPISFSLVHGMTDEAKKYLQKILDKQSQQNQEQLSERHSLGLQDLIAMIRVSPLPLKDEQILKAADLLRQSLSSGNQVKDFVLFAKEQGESQLSKSKWGLLLSASGQDEYTTDFLPSLTEAVAIKNRQTLNLLARHHMAIFKKRKEDSERELAWKATMAALDIPSLPKVQPVPKPQGLEDDSEDEKETKPSPEEKARVADEAERAESLTRAVELAPDVRQELGKAWLQDSFMTNPERGREVLARIGAATSQLLAQTPQDEENRTRHLELQQRAVELFFSANPALDSNWRGVLNILATNWLKEAEVTQQYSKEQGYGSNERQDRYGNFYYFDDYGQEDSQIKPIKVAKILATTPKGGWFETIDSSIRPQFVMTICKLWLKIQDDAKAFPYIEQLAATHPSVAKDLANDFLDVWTSNHDPNQKQVRSRYWFFYEYDERVEKIPLTRSKQDRNLKELTQWLERLRMLSLDGELDEEKLVNAFMTCHSRAEVYRIEDIERVLGAWGTIKPGTMAKLIQQMRLNLALVWQDPAVQDKSKTKRKKVDIDEEATRGYAVANQVLEKAIELHPGDWQLLLAKACIMHDENDFLQKVKPSSDFSVRRNRAFEVFSTAASAYIAKCSELAEKDQVNDAFDHWFYAALGATDIKRIGDENRAAEGQFPLIAAAMEQMKGEIGKRHRDRFANDLFTRMSGVKSSCKFRYSDAGFKIVGDNPLADQARKVHDYYKDLVTEIELVPSVDGDSRVGYEEPFGVYIDLRHTRQVDRESGGFSKYLVNQTSNPFSFNYGRATEDYRTKFEDATKAALSEQFEVLSITFNHAETRSIAEAKEDWRTTHYAYLLLKARGPEVDKIPALKIDLDFMDTSGFVVLPITSKPIAIDSKERATNSNASEFKIVQTLDDRQAKNGKLVVETKASASGLVPPIDSILDTSISGFELTSTKDSGVSVVEFSQDSKKASIVSERAWTLEYVPSPADSVAQVDFNFPQKKVDTKESIFQRYQDADLQIVDGSVLLVGKFDSGWNGWKSTAIFAVLGSLIFVACLALLRVTLARKPKVATSDPELITPFTLFTSLQQRLHQPSISGDQRVSLLADIASLERFYFSEKENLGDGPDLEKIATRWRERTKRGVASSQM